MFKPHRTLLFLLIIFTFFLGLSILPIPNSIRIADFFIKIPKIPLKPTKPISNTAAEKIIEHLSKEVSAKKNNNSSKLFFKRYYNARTNSS